MKTAIYLAPMIFMSAAAIAEPIYLECGLMSETGEDAVILDVNLDEEARTAGFVIRRTGWSPQGMTAIFTPTEVSFSPPQRTNTKTIYLINRVTLDFSEENRMAGQSFWRRGKCRLSPKIERQF